MRLPQRGGGSPAAGLVLIVVSCLAGARVEAAGLDAQLVEAAKSRDQAAVTALLRQGVSPNAAQPDGATGLHWASHWNDIEMARALVRAGAGADVANDYGITPLALAAQNGSAPMIDLLVRAGARVNSANSNGETALMIAAQSGGVEAVRALVSAGANVTAAEHVRGQTALMWAAAEGQLEAVRELIAHGADVNARAKSEFTPLMFAARVGSIPVVRALLDAGGNVNEVATDGTTALLMATVRGHVDVALFLLDRGADPNTDKAGYSPLHWAANTWESDFTLVYANHDTGEWAAIGGIPAERGKGALIQALLDRGANPNARMMKMPRVLGALSGSFGGNIFGATPFVLAARSGDVATMRLLVAKGGDPLLTARDGSTALMTAAGVGVGWDTTIKQSQRLEAAKLALELGVNPNAANTAGNTALHAAAFVNHADITALLLANGALPNRRNMYGDTALKIAQGYLGAMQVFFWDDVAKVLQAAGGVARGGPPGEYSQGNEGIKIELQETLMARAGIVDRIEALEHGRSSADPVTFDAEMKRLEAQLAEKDQALVKWKDLGKRESAGGVQ